jgi:hypothetical protein
LLLCILLDLALIGARVLLYTPLLEQPNSLTYIAEPVALLLAYAGVVVAVTAGANPRRAVALRVGLLVGMLTGALWVINLSLETFASLPGGILTSAPFLLGAFALWGVAGGASARQTDSLALGVLAAIWAALICVLITITFGFALAYTSLPQLEQNIATDPDYLRSHWTDVRAFAIANQFDAAASHMLIAPVVATIVGVIGAVLSDGWAPARAGTSVSRVARDTQSTRDDHRA